MPKRPASALLPHGAAVLCGLGLVTAVVGMFLPWLRSGAVLRDSFQLAGVIQTLGFLRGTLLELLLTAWFGVIPAVTLSIAAYAVGARRTGATLGAFSAIIIGTISGGATVESGSGEGPLGIAGTGPAVCLTGAVLAAVGAAGIFVGKRTSASRNAGGEL